MVDLTAYKHQWYLANKKRLNERGRAYYKRNREHLQTKMREYYEAHKDKIDAYQREWKDTHSDYMKPYLTRYFKNTTQEKRRQAIKKLGGKCVNCGCSEYSVLQLNHINGGGGKEARKRAMSRIAVQVLEGQRQDIDVRCMLCNWLHYLTLSKPEVAKHFQIIYTP